MKFKKTFSNYLALINIVIFGLIFIYDPSLSTNTLIKFGAKSNFKIVDFELFRLLTPMFLHVNFYHILFNSLALYIIGNQVETFFGKRKFLLIYFISGILGTMGSFITNDFVAAGASAGIFGLLGTHVYLFFYNRDGYRRYFGNDFLFLIGINVIYGVLNPSIDNAAHLFGLIGGLIVTLFILKQIPTIKFNQKIISIAAFSIIIILFGLRFNSYSNSPDYYFNKSVYEIREENYETAYTIATEGLIEHPGDESLIELVNAFVIQ